MGKIFLIEECVVNDNKIYKFGKGVEIDSVNSDKLHINCFFKPEKLLFNKCKGNYFTILNKGYDIELKHGISRNLNGLRWSDHI